MKLKLPILGILLTLAVALLAACGDSPTATPTVIERIVEVTSTPPTPPDPLGPLAVTERYIEAYNAGDIAALTQLWVPNGTFTVGPFAPGEFETENGLVNDISEIAENGKTTLSDLRVEGNVVTGQFVHAEDTFQEIGLGDVTGTFEASVEGERIASVTATFDVAFQQKIAAVFGPRELTVLAGAGQDTEIGTVFFPGKPTVRVGDTVTWKQNSDDAHTVTFLSKEGIPDFALPIPGGGPDELMINPQIAFPTRFPESPVETYDGTNYINSGLMSKEPQGPPGTPPNDTFSLTFTETGVFPYICFIHGPLMSATVVVVPAGSPAATPPEQVEAAGKKGPETILERIDRARQQAEEVRMEPGPNGTDFWFVRAGANDVDDPRAQIHEFFPADLTIKSGDTVVWGASSDVHTITFNPNPPDPESVVPIPQGEGPPILALNPQVSMPAKPAEVFDPAQYFNSATIGPLGFSGASWALTFEKPGTFEYFCVFHGELRMEGTITVVPR